MPSLKDSLLSILSGILLIFAFPPFDCWWLAWAALVPLLTVVLRVPSEREAANAGALFGLAFYPFALSWMTLVFGPSAAAFWCLFALWPALFSALLNFWSRRSKNGALLYVGVVLLWVGIEFFRSEVWRLNNSWMALGFSQTPFLPILQSASIFGVYGLSALIVAANLALARSLAGHGGRTSRAVIALFLVALAFGYWRLRQGIEIQGQPVTLALLQDESGDFYSMGRKSASDNAKDADILVWPEDSARFYSGREAEMRRQLSKSLTGSKAVAVLGMFSCEDEDIPGDWKNQAWVMAPSGKLLGSYDKLHPIPFVEKYLKANSEPRPVDTPIGKLGIQICYDFDFENGTRRMANQGAEILLVPDYDPKAWGLKQHLQHSAMAPMRALESGLWVGRAACSGVSQIIDPLGRVTASLGAGQSGILAGQARLGLAGTFHSRIGWIFGPVALVFSALVLLWTLGLSLFELLNQRKKVRL